MNYKALLTRAAKTFAQAFLSVFIAGIFVNINQVQLKALVIGAFSAGVSALTNLYVQPKEG